ncbi:MAG: cardiolipin synthase [Lachnospiraceae bacterium]
MDTKNKAKGKKVLQQAVFTPKLVSAVFIFLQILILVIIYQYFIEYADKYIWMSIGVTLLMVIYINNRNVSPEYKLAWMLPFAVLPIPSTFIYLVITYNPGYLKMKRTVTKREAETADLLKTPTSVKLEVEESGGEFRNLAIYMENNASPVYNGVHVEYFPLGEDKFKRMLEDLERAEKFIFLEYFIVKHGFMWDCILTILERKVQEGVEVRFMCDGTCAIAMLPYSYPKQLEEKGLKAKMFSPMVPLLSTHQNYRDHRKILVIDGKVAYNGGVNLGDEYINREEVYGHWKDTAVRIDGAAVNSFTRLFLQLWNSSEEKCEDFAPYLTAETEQSVEAPGYVIPYGDGPTNDKDVAKYVYLDIIQHARHYVHIMTPYLILDAEFEHALLNAVERGIDVRIIIPHIADKAIPFYIAQSNYPVLIEGGVKIYEYTPGFIHAKVFVSDDTTAVVGTINLDYRSLFLHFECGTYLYKVPAIDDIKRDFDETMEKSMLISLDYYRKLPLLHRAQGRVFKMFGPLM